MGHYEFAQICHYDGDVVVVYSTDAQTLEWIQATASNLRNVNNTGKSYCNNQYTVWIRTKREHTDTIEWWLLKQLCQRGWEPLSRTELRLEINEGDVRP